MKFLCACWAINAWTSTENFFAGIDKNRALTGFFTLTSWLLSIIAIGLAIVIYRRQESEKHIDSLIKPFKAEIQRILN